MESWPAKQFSEPAVVMEYLEEVYKWQSYTQIYQSLRILIRIHDINDG